MNYSNVPIHLIQPLVIDWLERHELSHEVLAVRSGVNVRTIRVIVNGERETVQFRVADLVVSKGLDMPEAWRDGPLGEWYEGTRLWKRERRVAV